MLDERLGQVALLAVPHRLPPDLRHHAHPRAARDAAPHLHLRAGARLGDAQPDHAPSASSFQVAGVACFVFNLAAQPEKGQARRAPIRGTPGRSSGRPRRRRREYNFADAADGEEPPPAVGSQAPRRSRLGARMSAPRQRRRPGRCRRAIASAWSASSSPRARCSAIFVVAYLFYLGKSTQRADAAGGALAAGGQHRVPAVVERRPSRWRCARCAAGTDARVRRRLGGHRRARRSCSSSAPAANGRGSSSHVGLTPATNLFGTTYYSLVGLHALHVTVGLLLLTTVLGADAVRQACTRATPTASTCSRSTGTSSTASGWWCSASVYVIGTVSAMDAIEPAQEQQTAATIEVPAPTAWPLTMALGITLVAAGLVTDGAGQPARRGAALRRRGRLVPAGPAARAHGRG